MHHMAFNCDAKTAFGYRVYRTEHIDLYWLAQVLYLIFISDLWLLMVEWVLYMISCYLCDFVIVPRRGMNPIIIWEHANWCHNVRFPLAWISHVDSVYSVTAGYTSDMADRALTARKYMYCVFGIINETPGFDSNSIWIFPNYSLRGMFTVPI